MIQRVLLVSPMTFPQPPPLRNPWLLHQQLLLHSHRQHRQHQQQLLLLCLTAGAVSDPILWLGRTPGWLT